MCHEKMGSKQVLAFNELLVECIPHEKLIKNKCLCLFFFFRKYMIRSFYLSFLYKSQTMTKTDFCHSAFRADTTPHQPQSVLLASKNFHKSVSSITFTVTVNGAHSSESYNHSNYFRISSV